MSRHPTYDKHVGPFDKIEGMRRRADEAANELIRANGWKYTCQTPGSRWLWEKKMPDGRTLLVDPKTALQFARFDAEELVDPAEIND